MWLRRILLILIGIALWTLVLFEWGFVSSLVLATLGLLLVISGALGDRLSRTSLTNIYSNIALILFNTIMALLLIETVAAIIVNTVNLRSSPTLNQVRASLPYYQSTDWGAVHWREIEDIPNEYSPFVVWEQAPFEGQSVTMREDGTRLTPGAVCEEDALTVFVFGGSTIWGMGANDEGTIPAYLQAALDETRTEPVCVRNFGVPGYVSTQGVIKLMTEIQQEHVPDIVIFYDGVNDVLATIQNNGAGAHQNLSEVAAAFEPNTIATAMLEGLRESYTFQLWGRLVPTPADDGSQPDWQRQADETTTAYLMNYAIVDRISQEYGFDYAFFWQPIISIGEKDLTPEEAMFAGGLGAADEVYALTYEQVEEAATTTENLFYIADVFDNTDEFIWVDPYHIVPEGNAIVAQTMLELMNLNE